jgi:hypothetical protein
MRWHGLSISDGRRILLVHRSTQMMLTHMACVVAAAATLVAPSGLAVGTRLAVAAALVVGVPVLTYLFRTRQVRRLVNPLAALVLIQVLYLARASAFVTVCRRLLRARRGSRSNALAADA